jgi:metal-responsive CopG/Arc/MetJ family transcriptional regulator
MKYTNVPLPTPVVDEIDNIVSEETRGFRSRPDFILHHIRIVIENIKKEAALDGSKVWQRCDRT